MPNTASTSPFPRASIIQLDCKSLFFRFSVVLSLIEISKRDAGMCDARVELSL